CLAKLSQLTTLELHLNQVPLKANADQLVPLCTVSHLTFHHNFKSYADLIELHPAIVFPNVETVKFDALYLECDDRQHPTTSVTTIFDCIPAIFSPFKKCPLLKTIQIKHCYRVETFKPC